MKLTAKLLKRFFSKIKVEPATGCWLWQAAIDSRGYGRFALPGIRSGSSHRAAWLMLIGPIPYGTELDHLCRNRHCAAPHHLEAVTHQVNVLRGISPAAFHAQKTHCKHGHSLTPDNVYINHKKDGKVSRSCKQCHYARTARNAERIKAYNQRYAKEHWDKILKLNQEWRKKNPHKAKEYYYKNKTWPTSEDI